MSAPVDSVDQILDDMDDAMQEIIRACDEKGTLVASTERGMQLCVEHKVAHKKKIHCMHMGCSPFNRDEYGINGGASTISERTSTAWASPLQNALTPDAYRLLQAARRSNRTSRWWTSRAGC